MVKGLRSLDQKYLKNEIGDFETIILKSLAIYYTKYEAKVLFVIFIDMFIFIFNWKTSTAAACVYAISTFLIIYCIIGWE